MSVILITMTLVLMFSAAEAEAPGGIMQTPSNYSLAHCIATCGDIDISYPFGIGSGCFRLGFDLTCDDFTEHRPKLYLGSSAIQVTDMYSGGALTTPIIFNLATTRPGTNTYIISWEPPAKGITFTGGNTFYAVGCDLDVTLFEYGTGDTVVGSCMSRCAGDKAPTGGPCDGTGCCLIPLPRDLQGFRAKLVSSTNITATQSDWLHPGGIMAFVSNDYYDYSGNATQVLPLIWTTDASNIEDAMLSVTIMDQPSCESAQMDKASYACGDGSSCHDSSSGGYWCYCSPYVQGNPYVLDGCIQGASGPAFSSK